MKISYFNKQFTVSKFLFKKVYSISEIKKLTVAPEGVTISFRDGREDVFVKDENIYLPVEEDGLFTESGMSFEDITFDHPKYSKSQLPEYFEKTKKYMESKGTLAVKEKYGENYAVVCEILTNQQYYLLVSYLTKDGEKLADHESYCEIDELGVGKALDGMDMAFLVSWDADMNQGEYGLTIETEREEKMAEYFDYIFKA